MAEKILTEILGDPNLRSEYRRQLADALMVAKGYRGTEPEYQSLMNTLASLECWLNRVFGQEEGKRFPEKLEDEVAETWQKKNRRKIADVLQMAHESLRASISKTLCGKESDDDSGLLVLDIEGVILPPDSRPIPTSNGEGREFEDPRFQERVKDLLLVLGDNGIHIDDIILIRGNVRKDTIRKISYVILEIPKLNREILVCDQVESATFVIYGIQDRQILMSEGKETLKERLGSCMIKIYHHDHEQWKQNVIDHLLKEVDINELKKIDVREQKGLRTEILKLIPTPEVWAGMKAREKATFKIEEMGLWAIKTKFGIEGDPFRDPSVHLELGEKIFGKGHESLQKFNLLKLKEEILKLVATPKVWAGMSQKERLAFRVENMGLQAIANKFGIKGLPCSRLSDHLGLGRKIYGEGHECLKDTSIEELKKMILEAMPTPEAWAEMMGKEKTTFMIAGMSLWVLARRFGTGGDPSRNHIDHLMLGEEIYGKGHECLRGVSVEKLKGKILKAVPTPEAWAGIRGEKRKKFSISNMGLIKIARKFGTKGNPVDNISIYLELGKKIYGEGHECLEGVTNEKLKEEILKIVPTPKIWAGMSGEERKNFKIAGMGLFAIASRFGVKGNLVGNQKFYLELGRIIFGEGHECLKYEKKLDLALEELRLEILKLCSTPQDWAKMKYEEKGAFKVAGMGLNRIARKLGVMGNPKDNHQVHLELGEKIYGKK